MPTQPAHSPTCTHPGPVHACPCTSRGATLAHYESYFLSEAGTVLPAAARTIGLDALAADLPQVGDGPSCQPW